jgi:ABC-2 type transport system permease protein
LEPDIFARALNPANYQTFDVLDDGTATEAAPVAQVLGEMMVPMLFGVLLMIAVLTGAGSVLRSVAEEKETRMIEMLVTTAAPGSILAGKLLAVVSAGLIHIAVWITVGAFAVPEIFDRIPNGGELTISAGLLATVSVSFVLGYFLFSVLAIFIGSVVSSAAEGQRQTGLLSLLVCLPIWMSGLFLNQPDGTIVEILTYFPFTAPTMLMIRLGVGSEMSAGEVAGILAIVGATGLAMLWVSARVFRAGILLSGQRITGRNVFEALRHAD